MQLENNEYYIERDDILNNSEFTETELTEVFGEKLEFNLKLASRKVYLIMNSMYGGKEKERQYAILRYMINNDETKQRGIMGAIIEYVRGSMYTGMDMQDYLPSSSIEERMKNQAVYPPMVKDILLQYIPLIKVQIIYNDEDIL